MNIETPYAYFSLAADAMLHISTGPPMATPPLATLRKDKKTRARVRSPFLSFLHTPVHQVKCRKQDLLIRTSPDTSSMDETSFPTAKNAEVKRSETNHADQRQGTPQEIIRR